MPTFPLYTRSNQNSPQYITRNNIPGVFDGSRQTIFIIHGWNNEESTSWLHSIKNALLNKDNVNAVIVGWGGNGGAGNLYYPTSASTTRVVGAEVGLIIDKLVSETSATYGRMYCMGHSLGGHTCGHAGRAASGTIGRITGMDPAGPLYENYPNNAGLYTDCASFVDVIHTNGQNGIPMNYGTNKPMGHMDFYPAAGGRQPGCATKQFSEDELAELKKNALTKEVFEDDLFSCSHGRAHIYMLNSITSDCFHACQSCTTWTNLPGSCSNCGGCGIMGYGAQGGGGGNGLKNVDVGSSSPYCQGNC
jgi:hypothetical protein